MRANHVLLKNSKKSEISAQRTVMTNSSGQACSEALVRDYICRDCRCSGSPKLKSGRLEEFSLSWNGTSPEMPFTTLCIKENCWVAIICTSGRRMNTRCDSWKGRASRSGVACVGGLVLSVLISRLRRPGRTSARLKSLTLIKLVLPAAAWHLLPLTTSPSPSLFLLSHHVHFCLFFFMSVFASCGLFFFLMFVFIACDWLLLCVKKKRQLDR